MNRGLLTAVGLFALAGSASAQERAWTPMPSPASATCPGGLCQVGALEPFFTALRRTDRPVQIIQFGDSHTAGDVITGSLRWRLQGRFERGPGIILTPVGEVGTTMRSLADREPLFHASETPDLVILAYGTNEGFDELLDPAAYEVFLRQQVVRVRQAAPGSALLILGPPEAMRGDGGGGCVGDPEQRWREPAMLAVVRDVQHRVAADMGVAFWDWRGRMGGDCSAHRLTLDLEPMVRGDHVHFTAAGGDWIGSLLFADLMAALDAGEGRAP